jgi:hypothetical protein
VLAVTSAINLATCNFTSIGLATHLGPTAEMVLWEPAGGCGNESNIMHVMLLFRCSFMSWSVIVCVCVKNDLFFLLVEEEISRDLPESLEISSFPVDLRANLPQKKYFSDTQYILLM